MKLIVSLLLITLAYAEELNEVAGHLHTSTQQWTEQTAAIVNEG